MFTPPQQPPNSFRVTLNLSESLRIDGVLLDALRAQTENPTLKNVSRRMLKELFKKKQIQLKGQSARPSSMLAKGVTFVDILGF